jgi:tRNA threonylcarbamoyladenosine modification (KEOPS) complex  Pcc1 subunit
MKKYKLEIEVELEDKPEWIYKSIQELLQDKESITLFRYLEEELDESIN